MLSQPNAIGLLILMFLITIIRYVILLHHMIAYWYEIWTYRDKVHHRYMYIHLLDVANVEVKIGRAFAYTDSLIRLANQSSTVFKAFTN